MWSHFFFELFSSIAINLSLFLRVKWQTNFRVDGFLYHTFRIAATMYQIHSCSTQTNHCVKSVQIWTRKNSVIGHLSHSELYNVLCLSLKEMQNYKRKLFLCPPHQHLKTAVCHNKFTLHHLKSNIYI